MKSRDRGGVVDSKLNVYGTERLKVAGIILNWRANLRRFVHLSIECRRKHLQYRTSYWRKGCHYHRRRIRYRRCLDARIQVALTTGTLFT